MSSYVVQYSSFFDPKSVKKLPKADLQMIRRVIERKLTERPEVFGRPLRQSLRGYRSLRVEDYRVIYRIDGNIVKLFEIGHRSVVYEHLEKKLRALAGG